MKLEFQTFSLEQHLGTLQSLLSKAFAETDSSREFGEDILRWKYAAASKIPTCFIGFHEGLPASFYGVLPRLYRYGEIECNVGLVVDVLTAPELQGNGVFTQTGKHVLACLETTPISLVIGFPIRPEVLPGHLKVGWKVRFSLPVYVYPIGQGESVGIKKKTLTLLLRALALLLRCRRHYPVGKVVVSDPATFANNSDVADFYRRTRRSQTFVLKKDPNFLQWRLSRPNVEYVCLSYSEKNVTACAIVRILEINGFRVAAIVDVDADSKAASRVIVESVIDFATQEHVDLIGVCMNQSLFKELGLGKLGFVPSFSKFSVITRKTQTEDVRLEEKDSRITWLDSDTI